MKENIILLLLFCLLFNSCKKNNEFIPSEPALDIIIMEGKYTVIQENSYQESFSGNEFAPPYSNYNYSRDTIEIEIKKSGDSTIIILSDNTLLPLEQVTDSNFVFSEGNTACFYAASSTLTYTFSDKSISYEYYENSSQYHTQTCYTSYLTRKDFYGIKME